MYPFNACLQSCENKVKHECFPETGNNVFLSTNDVPTLLDIHPFEVYLWLTAHIVSMQKIGGYCLLSAGNCRLNPFQPSSFSKHPSLQFPNRDQVKCKSNMARQTIYRWVLVLYKYFVKHRASQIRVFWTKDP